MLSSALLLETRSFGGSRSITSPKKNSFIYYELDEEVVNTYLCAEWYDGDDDGSWVLLEPIYCAPECWVLLAQVLATIAVPTIATTIVGAHSRNHSGPAIACESS